jgi:16S rRNA processing protein RimM
LTAALPDIGRRGIRPMNDTVILAAIAGAHGIKGEVRLKLFAESLDSLKRHKAFVATRGAEACTLTLQSMRPDKAGAIARFAEIADRTAAEGMRGMTLAVPREALPPLADGEYYHTDLIGRAVVSTEGVEIGSVIAVENFGAGDILEIQKADGKTFMVPFNPQAVPEVGPNAGDVITLDSRFVE